PMPLLPLPLLAPLGTPVPMPLLAPPLLIAPEPAPLLLAPPLLPLLGEPEDFAPEPPLALPPDEPPPLEPLPLESLPDSLAEASGWAGTSCVLPVTDGSRIIRDIVTLVGYGSSGRKVTVTETLNSPGAPPSATSADQRKSGSSSKEPVGCDSSGT